MTKPRIRLDFETYSDVDIKKAGAWAYSMCLQAHVLMMAWAIEDESIDIWTEYDGTEPPAWTRRPQDFTLVAHNAEFEYAIWNNVFAPRWGIPKLKAEWMSCTAARSSAAGLPRSLDDSAKALKVPMQKNPNGWRYIKLFCCPTVTKSGAVARSASPTIFPSEWNEFKGYCKQDIAAGRDVDKALPELIEMEQRAWETHIRINERGVRVDRRSVDALDRICGRAQQFYRATEHGDILGSTIKLISVLSMLGVEVKDCREDTLEAAANDPGTPFAARELITQRLDFAKTAVKKLKRMQLADGGDHRLRGMYVFHGAHTGRFTGALVQLQNLIRETVKDPQAAVAELYKLPDDLDDAIACYGGPGPALKQASRMIRPMLCAGPKQTLSVYDFSAIEALTTFWLCGATHMIELFKSGHDSYKYMASLIFGRAPEDYEDDSLERFVGKQTVLGCGYGMGWRKFILHCLALAGKTVGEPLAKQAVSTFRSEIPQVPAGWKTFDENVNALFRMQAEHGIGLFGGKLLMWVHWDGDKPLVLCCKLPSGRVMRWHFPAYIQIPSEHVDRDDEIVFTYATHRKMQVKGQQMVYSAIDQRCKMRGLEADMYKSRVAPVPDGWSRVTIWGGKFMENIIQAIARDFLTWAQIRCEEAGYPVVLHSHDENVFEIPAVGAEQHHEEIGRLMTVVPPWAPGAFIGVKGWFGPRYKK